MIPKESIKARILPFQVLKYPWNGGMP